MRSKIARYAATGLLTFGVYLAAGQCAEQLHLPFGARAIGPFALAVISNYLLQRRWVFEDRRPACASLPRYAAMIGLGCAINGSVLAIAPATAPFLMVQVLAASLVVLSNASLAFSWVFLERSLRH